MKNSVFLSLILVVLFTACNSQQSGNNTTPADVITNVDAAEFKKLSDAGDGIILDVRTPDEVNAGYIKNASVIDFYDEAFVQKINRMQKDKTIYVYCKSGGRSSKAADLLKQNGFAKVVNLNGGIMAWQKNGYELVKPEGATDTNIKQLSLNDFNAMLKTSQPVLVDFHTQWCVPCKRMAPVVDKLTNDFKDKATILRIDVDASKEVADFYKIAGVPVFILFKNGEVKWQHSGMISEEELTKVINSNM